MSDNDNGCQDRWHDDLAAYALGALSGRDAAAVEEHVAECEACSDRLLWLQPAVDLVPASVSQVEPPPELRANLMAIVEAEAAAAEEPDAAPARPERRRSWWRLPAPVRPALAGLALLALLVVGVGGYLLGGDGGGDAESYAVKPLSPKLAASGELEVADGKGTLTVDDLPPISEDQVYQAWTSNGEDVRPSSVFVADARGHATAAIPEVPADTNRVLVTREPAGGSQVATTGPVAAANLD